MKTNEMKLRLAFRHEGECRNAYLAVPDTMDGAKLIGSIIIGAVTSNSERKQAFMDLMKAVMSDGVENMTGTRPDHFDVQSAPESERSGHG
jgi:hypothetical protein